MKEKFMYILSLCYYLSLIVPLTIIWNFEKVCLKWKIICGFGHSRNKMITIKLKDMHHLFTIFGKFPALNQILFIGYIIQSQKTHTEAPPTHPCNL